MLGHRTDYEDVKNCLGHGATFDIGDELALNYVGNGWLFEKSSQRNGIFTSEGKVYIVSFLITLDLALLPRWRGVSSKSNQTGYVIAHIHPLQFESKNTRKSKR